MYRFFKGSFNLLFSIILLPFLPLYIPLIIFLTITSELIFCDTGEEFKKNVKDEIKFMYSVLKDIYTPFKRGDI